MIKLQKFILPYVLLIILLVAVLSFQLFNMYEKYNAPESLKKEDLAQIQKEIAQTMRHDMRKDITAIIKKNAPPKAKPVQMANIRHNIPGALKAREMLELIEKIRNSENSFLATKYLDEADFLTLATINKLLQAYASHLEKPSISVSEITDKVIAIYETKKLKEIEAKTDGISTIKELISAGAFQQSIQIMHENNIDIPMLLEDLQYKHSIITQLQKEVMEVLTNAE